jgi:hypothetical protein
LRSHPRGDPEPAYAAPGAALRTDVPGYRIYRQGTLAEQREDIRDLWRDELVAFLLGCSLTFEHALIEAGVPVRNVERHTMISMFVSHLACVPAGRFQGPMVVTMRPLPAAQVDRVCALTSCYPHAHGAPIHIGDPEAIGITRPGPTRLRRAGPHRRTGDPGLLGLQGDPASGRGQSPCGPHDHPRTRADVRDGPSARGGTRPTGSEEMVPVGHVPTARGRRGRGARRTWTVPNIARVSTP